LHVENFGTWRDTDGRLVWGVNDFDEAYPLPYTNDLVRLATSAFLAVEELDVSPKRAAAEILRGYTDGLKAGGKPFVLVDRSTPLRDMARHRLNDPEKFWKKLRLLVPLKTRPRPEVIEAIEVHSAAGKNSAAFFPSHCRPGQPGARALHGHWRLAGRNDCPRSQGVRALRLRLRRRQGRSADSSGGNCAPSRPHHDPFWKIHGAWVVRRLSPDCFRLELAHLPRERDELYLLYCMGWETANIHLGSGQGAAILRDLRRKPEPLALQSRQPDARPSPGGLSPICGHGAVDLLAPRSFINCAAPARSNGTSWANSVSYAV
jgi:hypothetical protein